ncbi:MAG: hypothetical protein KGR98_02525, partial [Verrucomicrobia bacterium]|nr:hypothetical protein [Verrucomicrobiota bacterium]
TAPANFSITADAADTDGDGVYGVEFLVGTNVAGVVFSPPYNVSVTNLNAGTYTLSAIAMDNLGAMASNSVSVTVGLPVIVLAPPQLNGNNMVLLAGGLVPGTTNILETSSNLVTWTMVQTNIVPGGSAGFTNTVSGGAKFYRVLELQ